MPQDFAQVLQWETYYSMKENIVSYKQNFPVSISTTNIILAASKIIFMVSSGWKFSIENYTANSQLPKNAVKPAPPSLKRKKKSKPVRSLSLVKHPKLHKGALAAPRVQGATQFPSWLI